MVPSLPHHSWLAGSPVGKCDGCLSGAHFWLAFLLQEFDLTGVPMEANSYLQVCYIISNNKTDRQTDIVIKI